MSKDLAKEYTKRTYKEKTNYPIIWRDKVFTGKDLEAAFNAGRESVVENMPELEWREKICRDEYFLEACALGAYYLIKLRDSEFHVAYNYRHFTSCTSLTAAKQAVKERCKELIKQALGL